MISVDEAIELILEHRQHFSIETVPLSEALGRRLASPIHANLTQPPAAVSAMDGYAVRLADVETEGAKLHVIGDAPAGTPFQGEISIGEAVRIFTGGYVPMGADHIVIQEDVDRDGDAIVCRYAYSRPSHIRSAGRDFCTGDLLINAGTRLGPAELTVAAAANHPDVDVYKRPKVALLTNGNELRPPGSELQPGEIVSSNPFGLGALITDWGGLTLKTIHASDSSAAITKALESLSEADIIVPIGGASVGDHDHMRSAFAEADFEPVFAKIAVRPGKPTWFSKRRNQLCLGLPGNPASALVCAHLFLKVLIGGADHLETKTAILATNIAANRTRETFIRATAELNRGGVLEVTPLPDQDSSLMTPFLKANVLIPRKPQMPASGAGELTEILFIGSV
ncbi:MAG: molybdopterin molybdotransferase MoeA [Pseudomonadota bacterium]